MSIDLFVKASNVLKSGDISFNTSSSSTTSTDETADGGTMVFMIVMVLIFSGIAMCTMLCNYCQSVDVGGSATSCIICNSVLYFLTWICCLAYVIQVGKILKYLGDLCADARSCDSDLCQFVQSFCNVSYMYIVYLAISPLFFVPMAIVTNKINKLVQNQVIAVLPVNMMPATMGIPMNPGPSYYEGQPLKNNHHSSTHKKDHSKHAGNHVLNPNDSYANSNNTSFSSNNGNSGYNTGRSNAGNNYGPPAANPLATSTVSQGGNAYGNNYGGGGSNAYGQPVANQVNAYGNGGGNAYGNGGGNAYGNGGGNAYGNGGGNAYGNGGGNAYGNGGGNAYGNGGGNAYGNAYGGGGNAYGRK